MSGLKWTPETLALIAEEWAARPAAEEVNHFCVRLGARLGRTATSVNTQRLKMGLMVKGALIGKPSYPQLDGGAPRLSAKDANAAFLAASSHLKPIADVMVGAAQRFRHLPPPTLSAQAYS
jgi:hypothetical protein